MSPNSDGPGLRERKRLATRRAIQHAVLTLTLERGIDKVTVEDISRVAKISPRTFFNYFPSKDAAVVGEAPELAAPEEIERFVKGGVSSDGHSDMLAQLAELLSKSLKRAEDDREIHRLRREVLTDNAHLFGMRMATLRGFEQRLQAVVERRFVADHPELADDPAAVADRALLITLVAVAAMRHAWRIWAEGGGATPLAGHIVASFAEVYNIGRPTR
jgi:AcrR family transcriptional regulator